MPMHEDWDKFHVPECPECKVDTFVEEISLPGAYICRACGTSMTDGGGSLAETNNVTPTLPRDSNSTVPYTIAAPTLGHMEEDH